ncbi:hypothetical protein EHQ24_17935 [Leptospira noumeaensis]|uniref:Nucleotide-diphospho-sugar transferase n=1 Tax=Leptospira noumeaensis TaxID=2484964 RepID=A0A4R9HZQ4_9LEPT|nr:hypothetical protein [Leptospira noumeaensis]TGK78430.1 hypothetical protein EHQ24_17935 [Leptospira noumeaensis]
MKLPVLLIGFNRPDLTEITLNRILEYKPTIIYFAVDGARDGKEGEVDKVTSVRQLMEKIPKSVQVKTRFSKNNQGCRLGVSSAISWFFESEEMGIILEDDCFPDLSFFTFCEELLERYKFDTKIGMISGVNFFYNKIHLKESYFYSKYFHIWGWATWRRAWEGYKSKDLNLENVEDILSTYFKSQRQIKTWKHWIDESSSGKVDTWDHQWSYHNWKEDRISIMPSKNLVRNLGFREDGTHTVDQNSSFANLKIEKFDFPLVHPEKVKLVDFFHEFVEIFYYPSRINRQLLKLRVFIFNLFRN